MILADDIAAARGSENDWGGMFTSMHRSIQRAERFVLSDEVGIAAYKLVRTRPSSMLAAMPLFKLPYKTTWIEWSGGLATQAGWQLYPQIERDRPRITDRVTPIRMGCLVEALDDTLQRGQMTWAWLHPEKGINGSPIGVNFDWTKDGNVISAAEASGLRSDDSFSGMLFRRWVLDQTNDEIIINTMRDGSWSRLVNSPAEIDAVRTMVRHEAVWISRHGHAVMNMVRELEEPKEIARLIQAWEGDITGEAPFITAFLLMMNSRNAVDHTFNDLSRLNRAREKRAKPPFFDHNITKLHLSKSRLAAIAARKADARGTDVDGHFKIRKSGVWWWNEHWRGDRANPMPGSSNDT